MNITKARKIAKENGHKLTSVKTNDNGEKYFFIDGVKLSCFEGGAACWTWEGSETTPSKYAPCGYYYKDTQFIGNMLIFVMKQIEAGYKKKDLNTKNESDVFSTYTKEEAEALTKKLNNSNDGHSYRFHNHPFHKTTYYVKRRGAEVWNTETYM